MATRTYVFLIEKPDDSYEQRVEALTLHDARIMMYQESQKQPDWLSYRHIDTIDHDSISPIVNDIGRSEEYATGRDGIDQVDSYRRILAESGNLDDPTGPYTALEMIHALELQSTGITDITDLVMRLLEEE
jgi:hypothetical protein